MQDFMRLYSGLVEKCFNACTQDFTSKALTGNEVCIFLSIIMALLKEEAVRDSWGTLTLNRKHVSRTAQTSF